MNEIVKDDWSQDVGIHRDVHPEEDGISFMLWRLLKNRKNIAVRLGNIPLR